MSEFMISVTLPYAQCPACRHPAMKPENDLVTFYRFIGGSTQVFIVLHYPGCVNLARPGSEWMPLLSPKDGSDGK